MDRISGLSDDLLIKILSFLPTKLVVSTVVLSKRWEYLWMWLPILRLGGRYMSWDEYYMLSQFLTRKLPLHRAPVIERFCLKLPSSYYESPSYDQVSYSIMLWLSIAISRYLRELEICYNQGYSCYSNILPSSLYNCKSLVTLKLEGSIHLDVPRHVCLPSLKILQLRHMRDLSGESLRRLLSICPVLEDLLVICCYQISGYIESIIVNVPSLQSLSIYIPRDYCGIGIVILIEISTSSLKYLKLEDPGKGGCVCLIENMPTLREAYVDTNCHDTVIRSITSVKRLIFSSHAHHVYGEPAPHEYGGGLVFNQLEHLKLYLGNDYVLGLLVRLLEDSPNLRVLELFRRDYKYGHEVNQDKPIDVPECVMSSLQTFKWSRYLGTPQERDLVVYILANACHLKSATISFDDRVIGTKLQMIKDLSRSSPTSTTCRLLFE